MFSVSAIFKTFRRGDVRRSSVRALSALSAAELRDIGVSPDQIGDVVDAMVDSASQSPAAMQHTPARSGFAIQSRAAMVGCG